MDFSFVRPWFLKIASVKAVIAHIFQTGVGKLVSRHELAKDRIFQPVGVRLGRYTIGISLSD